VAVLLGGVTDPPGQLLGGRIDEKIGGPMAGSAGLSTPAEGRSRKHRHRTPCENPRRTLSAHHVLTTSV
jgi:hypothetical protein